MSTSLYPLKFQPILKEKIWGGKKLSETLNKDCKGMSKVGESWEISGVQDDMSVVSNGFLAGNSLEEIIEIYMGDIVGEHVYDKFGYEFPLLIKFIDATEVLSVQVHPDDEVAKRKHHSYGKTELWYVIEADKGAELIMGFKKDTPKIEYNTALQSGKLLDLLNVEKVQKEDVFFIPAGRVHATGAGILLAEIQQTSDVTYRIYDWGRVDDNGNSRELHTELASEVINLKAEKSYKTEYEKKKNETVELANCQYFKTNILQFEGTLEKDYNFIDSFIIYMCLEGKFRIKYGDNAEEVVKKGESVLIPAILKNISFISEAETKILETYIA